MKKTLFKLSVLLLSATVALSGCKKEEDETVDPGTPDTKFSYEEDGGIVYGTITDFGKGIGNVTLNRDTVWNLDGFVFVNSGQTLEIEEGTIIRGLSGQNDRASALIVARGGMIDAEGTSADPIIFTTEFDEVEESGGELVLAGSKLVSEQGLWGGVIILGNAKISRAAGTQSIEGIPTSESRGIYGGTDDSDNSGILKYVSILHGGTNIGAGNEINGLTMGGVGSGTTVEYIEVVANKDDGIECFGGSVNIKHAFVAFNGDDCYDFDEGYTGKLQYVVAVQSDATINPEATDHAIELDGGPSDNRLGDPKTTPIMSNATFIGVGGATSSKRAIRLIEYGGAEFYNMIISGFDRGIQLEELVATTEDPDPTDVMTRFDAGEIKIMNISYDDMDASNISSHGFVIKAATDISGEEPEVTGRTELTGANVSVTAEATGVSNTQTVGGVDVKGATTVSTTVTDMPAIDNFFDAVDYRGAIDPDATGNGWLDDWTYFDVQGYFAN